MSTVLRQPSAEDLTSHAISLAESGWLQEDIWRDLYRTHAASKQQRILNLHNEAHLVLYIQRLSDRGLPPTRTMIRNFASKVAKWPPSDAWISRFLKRNSNTLKSRWTTGIDRARHQADTEDSYRTHFELLYSKILKYDVEAVRG
jgi:hypothetical protein